MKCLVLGSAAGGGFPQWNCGCRLCELARSGDPRARPRSQVSVAVTSDSRSWLIVGASPDLRQQVLDNPALAPTGPRRSPVAGVVLVSADVDGMAGLLVLREQQRLRVFAPTPILRVLRDNRIFGALDPSLVEQVEVSAGNPVDTGMGLTLTLLEMPGKVPLYHEDRSAVLAEAATTYAARLESDRKMVVIAPACAEITPAVLAHLDGADLLLFDGTLYTDDEMIRAGVGTKTGQRMGHVSVGGPQGSLARLAHHTGRRVYIHINNTNPMLLDDSPERQAVQAAGFEVAHDGLEIVLSQGKDYSNS